MGHDEQLRAQRRAVVLARELAEAEQENTAYERSLSDHETMLGDAECKIDRLSEALKHAWAALVVTHGCNRSPAHVNCVACDAMNEARSVLLETPDR